ncbi:hypothetical protein [Fluviicola taffensis]|uniref:hypothetical protein n=1 Tax=Fluviicola taffensis TaxID=191579 RepID=UPI0031379282
MKFLANGNKFISNLSQFVFPRGFVARVFLFNHIRGEIIVYLRATGNKAPGL